MTPVRSYRGLMYVHTELMGFTPLLELNKASLSYLIRIAIGAKLDCTPGRVNPFHTLRGVSFTRSPMAPRRVLEIR